MCILIYTPSGETIPEQHLVEACKNNPDGFGWAIVTPDTILVARSMIAEEAISSYLEWREKEPSYPSLFHARIATHGTTDLSNCHPFHVGNARTVLAHNGIIGHLPDEKERSDTRIFAEDWLPELGIETLDDKDEVTQLEKFIGYSKMVVLTIEPSMQRWSYILNEELGDWDKDIWYSNSSYSESYYTPKFGNWKGWSPTPAEYEYVEVDGERYYYSKKLEDVAESNLDNWNAIWCEFCQASFVVGYDDDDCPQCGMCSKCDHWSCKCSVAGMAGFHEEIIPNVSAAAAGWSNTEGWYVDHKGSLIVWDDDDGRWREATDFEADEYESVFGPIWKPTLQYESVPPMLALSAGI